MTTAIAPTPTKAPTVREPAGRVLIIDDEETIRIALGRTLRRLGYDTADAPNAEAGLAAVKTGDPEIVFVDLKMPGMGGLAFLRALQASGSPRLPSVIVMSGFGNMDDVIDVMRLGAVDYLRKPWNLTELMSAMTRSLELRRKPLVASNGAAPATVAANTSAEAQNRAARFADLPEKLRRGEILLPATPSVVMRLRELVADQTSTIDDIATAIEMDPRVAADILRVANSALYTRLGRAVNVKAAVTRLGLRHVHNLVQTIFLQGFCAVREGTYRKLLTTVWRRSVARAVAMRALCDVLDPAHALNGDTAYLIGLMSDIGASLLLWVVSERSSGNLTADDVGDTGAVLSIVQRSHQQLAAGLLENWKFEKLVTQAVSQHHQETPPVAHLWWSLGVIGDSIATILVGEEDPTAPRPRDTVMFERCAAGFCLPSVALDRLVVQLAEEFQAVERSMGG